MKKIMLSCLILGLVTVVSAQEATPTPLQISGSVDTYYKYDFNKAGNIKTYFGNEQNSVSLGMIDLALKKSTGRHPLLVNYLSDQEDSRNQFQMPRVFMTKIQTVFIFKIYM